MALADTLKPCGPVVDEKAAERLRGVVAQALWTDRLEQAWPALAPVFAASPYLAALARRDPKRLDGLLADDPQARLEDILTRTAKASRLDLPGAQVRLRELKAELHLLTALTDLGGVWDLDQVTGALTRFADAAVTAALTVAARGEAEAGRLTHLGEGAAGPVPGWFCIAMGKQGAFELNYSSDIDVSVFFDPDAMPLAPGVESEAFAVRLTQRLSELMQLRTADGYVFRMDLRLRPDPSSTQAAVPIPAALDYYESVGQNWERAAFIKARPCAGDIPAAQAFLAELQPFVWRRNLDFAAIADIHSIKRQIHAHKVDERMTAKGFDVKLGAGGIREIEFYVQTQQLILGGRNPGLRSRRTLDALAALTEAGHVAPQTCAELTEAYGRLRSVEHRIQMLADEQTHRLPEADADRRRVAALSGYDQLRTFDAAITRTLKGVNARYGELFPSEEPLSSRFGSLVFTGVGDDPETLATLKRLGFSNPPAVAATIRSWHHGHIPATATERGRELFTRLAPRLLEAAQATGAPDAAFNRFADFFSRLSSGVQLQSLFLAQPNLFELVVQVMAFAPRLAATLARRPAAIDAMLDGSFFEPIDIAEDRAVMRAAVAEAAGFEAAMDVVRVVHREQAFRVGVQVMSGAASAVVAGKAFADLADVCIDALADAALAETERLGGAFPGDVAVVALGKCGSREMSATSDLDLMTLYRAADPHAGSQAKSWDAVTFYGRFTQRLIAALSSQTGQGGLYEVDMQLRPSGTKGPVAVSFAAFEGYYQAEAETWELLALTRARVVWSTSPGFAADAEAAFGRALRRPRDRAQTAKDVREMRELMHRERPAKGEWDLKLSPGGLVDIEFAAQFLQIAHAAEGGPLSPNTAAALAALRHSGLAPAGPAGDLEAAWRLQQDLTQLLKVALGDTTDPSGEPPAFRALLARAGGVRDFRQLKATLGRVQAAANRGYEKIVNG
ncbi:MAG TPA: bifunctional [glutamine synthetase] adenylyltransferase/[glutamine synthetase]-adenylyl-L-tyrosine phosphorylase [Phenylobacterium sp.]|jgi:glutamate-ammonia-ligase adenylyltransferase|uniref:bifunctional [glutamine synthetase] adenylyltransferase/[glutamine synthetase]-adenylyl-L-tyrosine phosphorylase n=1 Tax=Phenylobacterium sp. TaxID=1871053 RepID=UPI002C3981D6|nr:bifunctional [glutamine synthetase] adenylyltransferase/[glutamine synthetase]-adenylyl-L-tyrosine phosphorylase [Phenylobacterium sp.]HXA39801.1 bifunctional [glutamine synthetase] adenylyltransferase/[glutamine synthetase]-adenylyl-L-tyrosine phosphorylase [Phenylobacterium sp.]